MSREREKKSSCTLPLPTGMFESHAPTRPDKLQPSRESLTNSVPVAICNMTNQVRLRTRSVTAYRNYNRPFGPIRRERSESEKERRAHSCVSGS